MSNNKINKALKTIAATIENMARSIGSRDAIDDTQLKSDVRALLGKSNNQLALAEVKRLVWTEKDMRERFGTLMPEDIVWNLNRLQRIEERSRLITDSEITSIIESMQVFEGEIFNQFEFARTVLRIVFERQ